MHLQAQGATLFISANGSPFERGKHEQRLAHVAKRCTDTGLPLIYVNQIGGQDELVFDGRSFVMLPAPEQNPTTPVTLPAWQEHALNAMAKNRAGVGMFERQSDGHPSAPDEFELIYQAAVLGLRDYVEKIVFRAYCWGCLGR